MAANWNNSFASSSRSHQVPPPVAHAETNGYVLHAPVLVLNASYEPINVCAARRAIILVLKGVAMMEEANGHFLHSARVAMRVPSVIRLLEYRRIPHQTRALSRKNILLRDRNTCQYCGKVLAAGELTLDHVIPRSRGGASTWENLVACCHACNRRKGNHAAARIQHEAHARAPRLQPAHQPAHHAHDGTLRREVAEVSVLLSGHPPALGSRSLDEQAFVPRDFGDSVSADVTGMRPRV